MCVAGRVLLKYSEGLHLRPAPHLQHLDLGVEKLVLDPSKRVPHTEKLCCFVTDVSGDACHFLNLSGQLQEYASNTATTALSRLSDTIHSSNSP